jgi:antirestriction protein ArdC
MATLTYSADERKARLQAAHAELTAAVEAIATSDDWRAFLDFARRLHSYSAQNKMWLYQQSMMRGWDDLGHVAGFRTWLSLGRYVRKGEVSLKVLAPCTIKVRDEETGQDSWRLRGFKVESVFAACQTDGEGEIPQPVRPQLLSGLGPVGAWAAVAELVAAQGYRIERAALYPANGMTSFATKVVTVSDRLEGAAALKTLVHELAHTMLHQPTQVDYHGNRARCEVEAETVAYLLCSELGLASDSYSFPYVATWSGGDMRIVTASADKALTCAGEIIAALDQASALV